MIRTAAKLAALLAGLVVAAAGDARADVVRASGAVRGDGGRLTLSWPAPVEFDARSVGGRHVLRFARPAEVDLATAVAPLHRFVEAPVVGDEGRTLSFPLKPGIIALTFADKTRVVVDLFAGFPPPAAASHEGASLVPEAASAPVKQPVPAPNRSARKPTTPSGPPAFAGEQKGPTASLRFDWAEPVAAAAFRRAGTLWLVFDRPSTQDPAALRAAGGETLRSVEQRAHPQATVLRLEPGAGGAVLRRDGLAWILDLGPKGAEPANAIEPALRQDPDGAILVLPVAEPGTPVALTDPGIGDTLVVVAVVPLGHGLARDHGYTEARLLASLQGLVVRPLVDDLEVRPGREGVELARPGGWR